MSTPITPAMPTVADPIAPISRGGWFAQLALLVRWELFLAWRRRAMMITLGSLLLVGYLLVLLVEYLVYYSSTSDSSFVAAIGDGLSFPGALGLGGSYIANAGMLLFVVLAGALIGSEYSYSTLRLSLARGVGRGQLLAAQIVALALLAFILTGLALGVSGVVGALGSALGLPGAKVAAPGAVLAEVVLYWLALTFNIFAYALVSVWIGTLTRSVAGAIAGPLVFVVVEVVAADILITLGFGHSSNTTLYILSQIPQYLMGQNTSALITLAGAGPYPLASGSPEVSAAHAVIVSVIYCALFIFISYLALRYRDVVE